MDLLSILGRQVAHDGMIFIRVVIGSGGLGFGLTAGALFARRLLLKR